MSDDNGWDEYSKLVLSELNRLSGEVEKLATCVNSMKLEINTIKMENKNRDRMYNALFGTGGGAVGGVAILLARHFGLF
jgi:hypothetical protein